MGRGWAADGVQRKVVDRAPLRVGLIHGAWGPTELRPSVRRGKLKMR